MNLRLFGLKTSNVDAVAISLISKLRKPTERIIGLRSKATWISVVKPKLKGLKNIILKSSSYWLIANDLEKTRI